MPEKLLEPDWTPWLRWKKDSPNCWCHCCCAMNATIAYNIKLTDVTGNCQQYCQNHPWIKRWLQVPKRSALCWKTATLLRFYQHVNLEKFLPPSCSKLFALKAKRYGVEPWLRSHRFGSSRLIDKARILSANRRLWLRQASSGKPFAGCGDRNLWISRFKFDRICPGPGSDAPAIQEVALPLLFRSERYFLTKMVCELTLARKIRRIWSRIVCVMQSATACKKASCSQLLDKDTGSLHPVSAAPLICLRNRGR